MTDHVQIVEVGPRDGLQNESKILSLDTKLEFISRLANAGIKRIETASFVHPKRVPTMANSDALMHILNQKKKLSDYSTIGLALNAKGVERAILANCNEINFTLSVGESFGIKNQGMDTQTALMTLKSIIPGIKQENRFLSVTLSTCFGDPYEGEIDENKVIKLALKTAEYGVDEIVIADTIGVADPWKTKRILRTLKHALGTELQNIQIRVHFHNTRNTALANIYAAIEEGVYIIDASCGGIGGCPFAPGATGNIATEDVIFMLERAGIETNINLEQIIEITHWIENLLGHKIASGVSNSGVFPK